MTETHCPYCSLQCGMRLVSRRAPGGPPQPTQSAPGVPQVQAWEEFPVNQGALCRKGWNAAGLVGHRERLTTPLLRDRATGELRPASWDEALDLVADRLTALRAERGPDSVAVFGGGGLTNEKAYQLGKFARVALGTSQIDYNGRWCMSSAATAGTRAFGVDRGLPFPLADLEQTDVVVLVGSNLAETMPPAARHLDALRERGGTVVVVDPRRTPTADRADLLLQPVPGTDLALALGVLHLLVAGGHVDEEFVAARTTGFDGVRRSVAGWWPERVERVTGVAVDELRELVRVLAGAPRAMVLTARGAEQHSQGTDTVLAWINVALALGQCGRAYGGYGCLTGQGNGQGGREHGQKADQLPGYRMIDDPVAREHVAGVWGVPTESLPGKGRSAYELLEALGTDTGPRALLVFGSNVVVSAPNATHVRRRLESLDRPAGRRRHRALGDRGPRRRRSAGHPVGRGDRHDDQPGGSRDPAAAGELPAGRRPQRPRRPARPGRAPRLAGPVRHRPEQVFSELGRASAGGRADYAGITYERIRAERGVFWPCPAPDHPGTPGCSSTASRPPTGAHGSTPSSTGAPPSRPAPTTPST